jgi:hypothetical protein
VRQISRLPTHGDSKVVRDSKSKKNLNLLTFVICRPTKKQREIHIDNITLENGQEEGFVFDIGDLMEKLEGLSDPRKARGKRYSLSFLLVIILLAKLAGEDTPKGIAEWLQLRQKQIVAAFNSKRDRVPACDTVRCTLAETVSESELQQSFCRYLHQSYGGQQSILVALGGKTLQGTIPKGKTRGVHLLAAYLPEEGIVLMQVAVDLKLASST